MKRKFVVDTNTQYLYHMNSKNPPIKLRVTAPGALQQATIPDPPLVEKTTPTEVPRKPNQRILKKPVNMQGTSFLVEQQKKKEEFKSPKATRLYHKPRLSGGTSNPTTATTQTNPVMPMQFNSQPKKASQKWLTSVLTNMNSYEND